MRGRVWYTKDVTSTELNKLIHARKLCRSADYFPYVSKLDGVSQPNNDTSTKQCLLELKMDMYKLGDTP